MIRSHFKHMLLCLHPVYVLQTKHRDVLQTTPSLTHTDHTHRERVKCPTDHKQITKTDVLQTTHRESRTHTDHTERVNVLQTTHTESLTHTDHT